MSRSSRLSSTRLSELHLEPAYIVSKKQSIASVIEVMRRYEVDRVLVSDQRLLGTVTVKDIFYKLSSRRVSRLSPTSFSVAAFASHALITARPEETVLEAADRMQKHTVSSLPVIGDDGTVMGLVTKLLTIPLMSHSTKPCKEFKQPILSTLSLRAKLSSALERLMKTTAMELIVVEGDRPIGVVGEREVALALFSLLRVEQIRHFDTFIKRLLVLDVVRRFKTTLSGEENAREAAGIMRSSKVNTLPLVREGRLEGVVTRDNLFERLLRLEAGGVEG